MNNESWVEVELTETVVVETMPCNNGCLRAAGSPTGG